MEKDLKDLLLRDLCARLAYGVKVQYYDYESERVEIDVVEGCENMGTKHPYFYVGQYSLSLDKLKPVLYPLSSMTQEQLKGFYDSLDPILIDAIEESRRLKNEYEELKYHPINTKSLGGEIACIDFFNKYHFDNSGLIEKGLAIDATNLNVY